LRGDKRPQELLWTGKVRGSPLSLPLAESTLSPTAKDRLAALEAGAQTDAWAYRFTSNPLFPGGPLMHPEAGLLARGTGAAAAGDRLAALAAGVQVGACRARTAKTCRGRDADALVRVVKLQRSKVKSACVRI